MLEDNVALCNGGLCKQGGGGEGKDKRFFRLPRVIVHQGEKTQQETMAG